MFCNGWFGLSFKISKLFGLNNLSLTLSNRTKLLPVVTLNYRTFTVYDRQFSFILDRRVCILFVHPFILVSEELARKSRMLMSKFEPFPDKGPNVTPLLLG